jgi:hypothetical protein
MTDPCDFLTPTPQPSDPTELRQRLLTRTLTALRRRRWLRRAGFAAALAACYAAGALTTLWLRPVTPAPAVVRGEPAPQPHNEKPEADRPAVPDKVVPQLVKAADHALATDGDPLAALRGYTKAIDEGGADALAISTDDSFLMMAIKKAREKENAHAH